MDTDPHPHSRWSTSSPHEEMRIEETIACSYMDGSVWKEVESYRESVQNPTKIWTGPFQDYPTMLTIQSPKASPPAKITKETCKFSCRICFKGFNHASSLWRHRVMNCCNSNSFTNSIRRQAETYDDTQETFEDHEFYMPTVADEASIPPSIDDTQSEGAKESLMKKVNTNKETWYGCTICNYKTKLKQSLKTHYLVHTDNRPFRCLVRDCTYRGKSLRYLRRHSRAIHHINLSAQTNANPTNEDSGSRMEVGSRTQVNVTSSTNCSLAFACMLCEFIGDSELAALEHAQQHKTFSV